MSADGIDKIAIFQRKEIRKQLHHGEWWFVINDVIAALTGSINPTDYLKKMRRRDSELAQLFSPEKGGGQIEPPLALLFNTPGGKQKLLSWNTEGIFRLIQSIPSKKAEPFKRWLARTDDVQGMTGNIDAARRGGAVAGTARKQLEEETGRNVVNKANYLSKKEKKEIDK